MNKFCENCGKELKEGADICTNCGKYVNNQKNKENKKKMPKWTIVLIVVLCMGIVGAVLSTEDNKETQQEPNKQQEVTETKNDIEKTETPVKSNDEIIAELKEKCQEYDYETIYRYAEDYKGKYAKLTGEVIEVQESNSNTILRVNITKNDVSSSYSYYTDTIYVTYTPINKATRIMEDDIVTIYGELKDLKSYTSILGATITLPHIMSSYIEINNI